MKLFLASLLAPVLAVTAAPALQSASATSDDLPASHTHRSIAWKTAEPADILPRGEWWTHFADPTLDELITGALAANQDLRAAAARVEQARAAAGVARGGYWPQIAAQGDVSRARTSSTTDNVFPNSLTTTYQAPLGIAWELDLFGRVRHMNASARADAEGTAATFESVRLALTTDVAATYFSLRALDQELSLVREGVRLRRRARELAQARYRNGTAAELDVARADTELATTEAESAALANQRAAVQHALAVLLGTPATDFRLSASESRSIDVPRSVPQIPSDLPAALLERRPDIAAAERALAAANARIGVAKAAFFPAISLTGGAGYASADLGNLFKADSRIWSIGPSLYLPIFQGGRNRANLERSRAAYDEAVAVFRQRVLIGFREVQDALTATQLLAEQAAAQERALTAARRATALAQTRYDAGFVSFLEVIDAQRTALATERTSVHLEALRLNTRVALIKALGGGWHSASPRPSVAQR
jgi:outer membrane protein, multidrug efflux system